MRHAAGDCKGALICRTCAAGLLGVCVRTFDHFARKKLQRIATSVAGGYPRWMRDDLDRLIRSNKETAPCQTETHNRFSHSAAAISFRAESLSSRNADRGKPERIAQILERLKAGRLPSGCRRKSAR